MDMSPFQATTTKDNTVNFTGTSRDAKNFTLLILLLQHCTQKNNKKNYFRILIVYYNMILWCWFAIFKKVRKILLSYDLTQFNEYYTVTTPTRSGLTFKLSRSVHCSRHYARERKQVWSCMHGTWRKKRAEGGLLQHHKQLIHRMLSCQLALSYVYDAYLKASYESFGLQDIIIIESIVLKFNDYWMHFTFI